MLIDQKKRDAIYLAIVWLLIMELLSLPSYSEFSCVVNPNNYGAYYAHSQECPPLHIFLFHLYACVIRIITDHDWMLVIFTAILAIFTGRLWYSTEKDTRILQRAYLNVLPAGIEPWVSDAEMLACDVFFFNAGNLPATRVSWNVKCCLNRDPSFEPPKVSIDEKNTNIVAPKGRIRKGLNQPLKTEELVSFRAAIKLGAFCWLYVYGRVRYHDGFRDNRWTDFCHRYNLLGTEILSKDGLHIGRSHGRQHERGNGTDEGEI